MYAINCSHIHIVYLIENVISLSTCIYARYADGWIPIIVHCIDSVFGYLVIFVQLMFQFYKSLSASPIMHSLLLPLVITRSSSPLVVIPFGRHPVVIVRRLFIPLVIVASPFILIVVLNLHYWNTSFVSVNLWYRLLSRVCIFCVQYVLKYAIYIFNLCMCSILFSHSLMLFFLT